MVKCKGCLKSPIDVRDYKIAGAAKELLPEAFEVSILPRVKDQKSVLSCVAHVSSSILEYYEELAGRNKKLSTNFIYGIQKSVCGYEGQGMYPRDACKIVSKYGDMLEKDCSGNTEVPDCWEAAEKALANETYRDAASAFKIKSYFRCNTTAAIKQSIMHYGPVLGVIDWYTSYIPNKNGVLATHKFGTHGYHAVMIYGWDKTGYKCQNSWGTSWGNKGRFIAPYEIKIEEARCFIDELDENIVVPKRNAFLDFIYKILNFILNLFKK